MIQRIEIPNTVNSPNFISSWMLNDTDMCDEIVNFFEANPVMRSWWQNHSSGDYKPSTWANK